MELQLIDAMPVLQPQARGPVAIDEHAMRKSRAHRAVPVDVETGSAADLWRDREAATS
ncbi:hypothetical protein ACFRCI_26515 [Streptomyces sp. NPDC056638]|uniref:hypothetical protein n=1 Tax=Streptomyces sp. NPDC056638 TaxID=3345887 RepID=UPI0036AF47DE